MLTSIAASCFSWQQNIQQQKFAARVELSQLIERMNTLQHDGSENINNDKGELIGVANAGEVIPEILALARQAADIADQLEGGGTASEHYSIASAFKFCGEYEQATRFAQRGLTKTSELTVQTGLLHIKAHSEFRLGDYAAGRSTMLLAIRARDTQPPAARAYGLVHSYTYWAEQERRSGNCDGWKDVMAKARTQLEQLPAGSATRQQGSKWIKAVGGTCPV
ncbi:hypothetical protein V6V47_21750 [Micromonospora sp. CPCC 205539]|uniref:hypothetical protein n=1 Tax=Micromonospora sp. CPCC 205539 TaxID=3122408 RepID=UPI002FF16E3A